MRKYSFSLIAILMLTACDTSTSTAKSSASSSSGTCDETRTELAITNNNSVSIDKALWHIGSQDDFYKKYSLKNDSHANIQKAYDNYTQRGEGVVLGVIDTELNIDHQALKTLKDAGKIVAYDGKTGKKFNVIEELKYTEGNRSVYGSPHGSAVTGIIVAEDKGSGTTAGIVAKIDKLVFIRLGVKSNIKNLFDPIKQENVDIVNNSWGTLMTDATKEILDDVVSNGRGKKGTIIVWASGNDNKYIPGDISSHSKSFAVGSSNGRNIRASYSNFGAHLDFLAPGGQQIGIPTISHNNNNGYIDAYRVSGSSVIRFTGTSAAAPVATGIIALMLSKDSTLTRDQVYSKIRSGARKIGGVDYNGSFNDCYGYGKIDAYESMK